MINQALHRQAVAADRAEHRFVRMKLPVGDWASMAYRTSRVGTSDTPLVGAYTVKGWAHPGPLA